MKRASEYVALTGGDGGCAVEDRLASVGSTDADRAIAGAEDYRVAPVADDLAADGAPAGGFVGEDERAAFEAAVVPAERAEGDRELNGEGEPAPHVTVQVVDGRGAEAQQDRGRPGLAGLGGTQVAAQFEDESVSRARPTGCPDEAAPPA